MKYRLGELFSGPGGIAWGALKSEILAGDKKIGVKHVFAIDVDKTSCETYLKNIPGAKKEHVYCKDVQDIKFGALPDIDILAFGFPCNDFSIVGEQKGVNGSFGPLYTYGVKCLNAKNPIAFVAENVGGLQSANDGKAMQKILSDVEKAGDKKYGGYVLTTNLYKFEEYGVPQKRHRYIIVGIRADKKKKFAIPKPTTKDKTKQFTAKAAIEAKPIPITAKNQELTRQSPMVVERLKAIPPGENAWFKDLPKHLQLNVKGARLSQIYKRLKPDEPAYTVTGSGGGGTHVYHWKEPRALTNRERARLQTFPDSFVFEGSKEQVRKQIGMAVPPEGAKVVFQALLKTLTGKSYQSIPGKMKRGEL